MVYSSAEFGAGFLAITGSALVHSVVYLIRVEILIGYMDAGWSSQEGCGYKKG
jgi:hypothetical protein